MRYTFSLPVWSPWHSWHYLAEGLRSHRGLVGDYIVHTDRPDVMLPYLVGTLGRDCYIDVRKVEPQASYFQFSEYQQQVFDDSEACVFLSPDAIILDTTFQAIQKAVDAGYKMIMCPGINTVAPYGEIPYSSPDLQRWAVDHLIPTLRGNIWDSGAPDSMSPQTMFFQDGNNFWTHAFHHHPLCIVNDKRGVKFAGSTIDWITPSFFSPEETIILSGHDALMVELSPPNKFDNHPRCTMLNGTELAMKVCDRILPSHTNLFKTPVPLVGTPTDKYTGLIKHVTDLLENPKFQPERRFKL